MSHSQVAVVFDGVVVTIEHGVMILVGLFAGALINSRLRTLRGKLADIERKLETLAKGDSS